MRIPVLALGDILLTSIQSDITDEHAVMLQTDILERMRETRARGVVLDITTLDVVDSYMARVISETVQMARLMGGDVVVTGMNPMVALTLVEMGRELMRGMAALTLEQGVEKLRERFAEVESDDEKAFADVGRRNPRRGFVVCARKHRHGATGRARGRPHAWFRHGGSDPPRDRDF